MDGFPVVGLPVVERVVGMSAALVEVATDPRSPHLWFRPWTPTDGPGLHRLTGDGSVMRYVNDGTPMTREASDRLLASMMQQLTARGFGHWAVGRNGDPDVLGCAALFVPEPDQPDVIELGVWFRSDVWGAGYGMEAGGAALRFAFGELGLERVIATWHRDHPVAGRTMTRLGFTPSGSLSGFAGVVLADLTRADWRDR